MAKIIGKFNRLKEVLFAIMGAIIIIVAISSWVYVSFFVKPEVRIPSAPERRALEERLIERYGSLENIPKPEYSCGGNGSGHPLDNCW